MGLTIREKAEYVGTFRGVRVYLMEMLARWTPLTPELEAKVLFGRHIWDLAQQADALGKRALELRAPLHYTLRPALNYSAVLDQVAAQTGTAERIQCFYDVILPGLDARQAYYLENSDRLQDEPTVRIIESARREDARLRTEARAALQEMEHLAPANAELIESLRRADENAREFVAFGSGRALSRSVA